MLLAILGGAAVSIALKIFSSESGNRFGIILGNYLTCIVLAVLFLPEKGQIVSFPTVPLVCGLVAGCFYVGGLVSMQSSIGKNGAAITAAFAKLGLIVSVGLSLFFGERPGVMQLVGVALALVAMVVMNVGGKRKAAADKAAGASKSGAFLLLLVLLAGGGSEGMSKVFDQVGSEAEKPLFLFYLFSMAAVLTGALALLEYRRTKKKLRWQDLAAGVAVGAPNYLSSLWLLKSLSAVPGTVAYPVVSGGAIVVVTLVSVLFLHEKPTRRQAIGLGLILVSLVLLNLPAA